MTGEIIISNRTPMTTEIDIEGIIGVPEEWQFDQNESKVATYKKFREELTRMREIKSRKIVVNIRSIGGSVCDALLIYDTLAALGAEVTTRCYGYVASAATIIAQAASEGRRQISQNALYLVHQSTAAAEGNSIAMSQTIEMLDKTNARIADIYAQRSGLPTDKFAVLMGENNGNGRWLAPQEAVDLGLADKIINSVGISNQMAKAAQTMNLPPLPEQTKITTTMKIKQTWRAICDLFADNQEQEEVQVCENALDRINKELEQRAEKIAALEARMPADNVVEPVADDLVEPALPQDNAIEMLQNKIAQLEAQTAKIKALPTSTLPKEDPSVDGETGLSTNQSAYQQDLSSLLER